MQPLDVGVYGPTKTAWEKILVCYARKNLGKPVTKESFPGLLKELWESGCMSENNIKAGFSKVGFCPFNPQPVIARSAESLELVRSVP